MSNTPDVASQVGRLGKARVAAELQISECILGTSHVWRTVIFRDAQLGDKLALLA
jgi:hypothetical protein